MTGASAPPIGGVLGIDTSTAASSVCVLRADGEAFESPPDPAALAARPGHSRELLPAVARQLDAAGLSPAELDAVAVGVGPGGYTGLRIGIATARALADAHGLGVHAVGSLAALAAGIDAPAALALIDARRGQVFAALEVDGVEIWEPFAAAPEAIVERVAAARAVGLGAPVAAGDGALRSREPLETAAIDVAPAESACHVVRALHVCRLAGVTPSLAPEAVVPRYLRAPDALPR